MSTKGALIFAHNNQEIDYFKIACVNALMIQKNLKIGVTIVTDEGTLNWALEVCGQERIDKCFENVIISDRNWAYHTHNKRMYKDTSTTAKTLPFYNCDHWKAYDLSPYDETLFIDADYLIMSDVLNKCWGSKHDIMLNHNVHELHHERPSMSKFVDDFGIKMYWATCIYFKKSELAKYIFSIVHHIYDNWQFYRDCYCIQRNLFRNDFAFSIAVHMLNGFNNNNLVAQLPINAIYKSFDYDDIHSVNGSNDITLLLEKPNEASRYILQRVQNLDVHIMNKWAIGRHVDKFFEVYS